MVGVQGIGGIPEPQPDRSNTVRDRKRTDEPDAPKQDGVTISSEAQAAASVARILQQAGPEGDVRPEKIDEARQALERGDYRNRDVVAVVADRIGRFLR